MARTKKPRRDVYQEVTDRILDALDQGTVPWRNPILSSAAGFPRNHSTDKPYRGINVFLLGTTAMCQGYRSAHWLTFKQAQAQGGNVRKGEKGSPIVFFKQLEVDDQDKAGSGEEKKKRVPMLKLYTVFNLEQIEGIEAPDIEPPPSEPVDPLPIVQEVLDGYVLGPEIQTGGFRAYYRPTTDTVNVPEPHDFNSVQAHAATMFHELIHSTGHTRRLDRGLDTKLSPYGTWDYGKEELVAECGAAFLSAATGILPVTMENATAYIDGWRKIIKGDKKLVVSAAAAAQRAVDHILGVTWTPEEATQTNRSDESPSSNTAPIFNSSSLPPDPGTAPPTDDGLADMKVRDRKLKLALRTLPPPPANLNLAAEGDIEQLRTYARRCQNWFNQHLDAWREMGAIDNDPRVDWLPPQHPTGSNEQMRDTLQAFPRPGQANLNSTATQDERSRYIGAVLTWFNTYVGPMVDRGVIDPEQSPVVNKRPLPPPPRQTPVGGLFGSTGGTLDSAPSPGVTR